MGGQVPTEKAKVYIPSRPAHTMSIYSKDIVKEEIPGVLRKKVDSIAEDGETFEKRLMKLVNHEDPTGMYTNLIKIGQGYIEIRIYLY